MVKKIKAQNIKIAIDSPSAAGAGTLSKMLAKNYQLCHLDTGKVYRLLSKKLMEKKPKNKIQYLKKVSKNISLKKLKNKNLLNDEVAFIASQIAKDLRVRKLVLNFQKNLAYNPPKPYKGSILDGRDIITKVVPDAEFKFFITATIKERSRRRFEELRKLGKNVKFSQVLKSMKKRDKEDSTRKHSRLKKTKKSILINTTNLTIKESFLKIKRIIDSRLK